MDLKQVANYLVGRYLVSNMKIDKKSLLKGNLLASYSVDSLGKAKKEVVYYDTPEFFFADKGINIYIVNEKAGSELVIRYDSEQVKRIEFLKNTPNFFKVKIPKGAMIRNFIEQINEAIYKVFPAGLHVNIDDMIRASSPQIRILKKCEQYRVVNNSGLKTTISFEDCTYLKVRGGAKFSQPTLEVTGDSVKTIEEFNTFLHSIIIDCPKLIRIENNELTVARKNL